MHNLLLTCFRSIALEADRVNSDLSRWCDERRRSFELDVVNEFSHFWTRDDLEICTDIIV